MAGVQARRIGDYALRTETLWDIDEAVGDTCKERKAR